MPLIGSAARLSGAPPTVSGAWMPMWISVGVTPVVSPTVTGVVPCTPGTVAAGPPGAPRVLDGLLADAVEATALPPPPGVVTVVAGCSWADDGAVRPSTTAGRPELAARFCPPPDVVMMPRMLTRPNHTAPTPAPKAVMAAGRPRNLRS